VLATLLSIAAMSLGTGQTFGALTAKITNNTDTAGTRTFFTCAQAEAETPGGYLAWPLDGTTRTEPDLTSHGRTAYHDRTVTQSTSYGCQRDTAKTSVTFAGNRCVYQYANYTANAPLTFSLEAWFRTSTIPNGKIIGLGDSRTTSADGRYDRHIYLDKDGRLVFGVWDNGQQIVYTSAGTSYADNAWHHVVATLSSAGQSLYVDGNLAMTSAQTNADTAAGYGFWKVGCGTLSTWADASGPTTVSKPAYFTGQLQYAAVYTVALSAAKVQEHYLAGAP